MRKIAGLIITIWLALLVVSCGTTQLTSLWKDPSYNAPPLKKLMVIAFRKNPINRRMWEDAVVAAIGKQKTDVSVVPSYQLFPDDVPLPEDVQGTVKEQGFDGVLVVYRATRDTLTSEVPGYTSNEAVTEYSRRWKTYVTRYEDVYHAGYTDTSLAVSVRTDLLLAEGTEGQLVWSATSKTIDPASRNDFRNEVAGTVARQLSKAHLIP
jgi:hypothetical protein